MRKLQKPAGAAAPSKRPARKSKLSARFLHIWVQVNGEYVSPPTKKPPTKKSLVASPGLVIERNLLSPLSRRATRVFVKLDGRVSTKPILLRRHLSRLSRVSAVNINGSSLAPQPMLLPRSFLSSGGDIWFPPHRKDDAKSLPLVYLIRLHEAGIGHWSEYATDLHFFYQSSLEKARNSILEAAKTKPKPYISSKGAINKQMALHRHIASVRRRFNTERDGWGSWLLDGSFRGFSSIWTMELTLSASDKTVKPIVHHLIHDLKFTGPYSVL